MLFQASAFLSYTHHLVRIVSNMKGTICQVKSSKTAGSLKKKQQKKLINDGNSFITAIAHSKYCDLENTSEYTYICKNGNKQRNKRMGDHKPRMLLKAIWVICLFQRQSLGIRSAAVESSIAGSWFLKEKRLSGLRKLLMLCIKFSRLLATPPQHSHLPS